MKRIFSILLSLILTISVYGQMMIPGVVASSGGSVTTLTNGVISSWKLDETSGDALDAVSTNDGTLVASPTRGVTGKIGYCYTFNGTSQYIDMGAHVSALEPTAVTLAAWFKISVSSYDTPASNINAALTTGYGMTTEATKLRGFAGYGTGVNITGGTSINTGAWFHAVFTCDGSYIRLYINGSSDATAVAFPYSITYTAGQKFFIAGRGDPAQFFAGSLDNITVWNRALTTDEITELYTTENAGTPYPW